MFENPREAGKQEISSSEQIFSEKLTFGAPVFLLPILWKQTLSSKNETN